MTLTIDHVAIEVGDFDARLGLLTGALGLELRRVGRLASDPTRRIAMLADPRGVKVELVEGTAGLPDRLLHLAFDTDAPTAVDTTFMALLAAGCAAATDPMQFEPARSRTATVTGPTGGVFQLVAYAADSPDRGTPRAAAPLVGGGA